MAQLVINNKISITTKKSPFKADHEIDANTGQMSEKSFQKLKNFQQIWIKKKT